MCLRCRTFCLPQLFTLRRWMYTLDVRVNTCVNTGASPQRTRLGDTCRKCSRKGLTVAHPTEGVTKNKMPTCLFTTTLPKSKSRRYIYE